MNKIHKYLGLTLLLPFVAWVFTGVFFFIKPGYQHAYQGISVKLYPLEKQHQINPKSDWQEIRLLKTILGEHLLVKTNQNWLHIDPTNFDEIGAPNDEQIKKLIADAMQQDPERYGQIKTIEGLSVITDTQVKITLDWPQLKLRQSGNDTAFINQMYKIHYLQWTGIEKIDRVLGVVGLAAVLLLALLGLKMALTPRRNVANKN